MLTRRALSLAPPLARLASGAGAKTAEGGTIADLFTAFGDGPPPMEPRFADLKRAIRPSTLDWASVQAACERAAERIQRDPAAAVPAVDFASVERDGLRLSPADAAAARAAGCVIVRGAMPAAEARALKTGVQEYNAANAHHSGFPEHDPMIWELYWSPPQVAARERLLGVQLALNRLWTAGGSQQTLVDLERPITYADRLRIRHPGDAIFALPPHIDGGSIERWEDPGYRSCYAAALAGDWQAMDLWDAAPRAEANMDLYGASSACSVFRTFQGWLALDGCGPDRGTLTLVPALKEAVAHVMLRPFCDDVAPEAFPGAYPGKGQDVTPEHHQVLLDALVSVPDMEPGDCVFWHPDVIHGVEPVHHGTEDSSVFYIPAAPWTPRNGDYLERQAACFLAGRSPPDFPQNHFEAASAGKAAAESLSPAGRLAMGV